MTATEFIKEKMKEIVNQFPMLKVSYQFKKNSNVHLLHVLPVEYFTLSEEYAMFEVAIMEAFYELFPLSSIAFVTDGDLVSISGFPEHIEYGIAHYEKVSFPSIDDHFENAVEYIEAGEYNYAMAS